MKSIRMCYINMRKWPTNSKIIMATIFVALSVFLYTSGLGDVAESTGINISPWVFPFLFTYRYIKITLMIPIVFIFSNAPFIDSNQLFCISRTGRKKWWLGQVIYIFMTSLCYIFLLFVSSIVSNVNNICWNKEWGEFLGSAGTTNMMEKYGHAYDTVKITGNIIKYYTPLQAMVWSLILMVLSFFLLGMLMFVINSITGNSIIGSMVDVVLITLTAIVEPYPNLNKYSPMSWNSLNNIDIANRTEYPSIDYVLIVYTILIMMSIVASYLISKRFDINAHNEE